MIASSREAIAGKGALIAYGNFLFRFRNVVFPVVTMALLFLVPPAPAPFGLADDWPIDLLGVAVVVAGQALRFAVIGYAYIKRGGLDRRVYADKLVIEGFFAHSRNPLYLGNLIVLCGLFLIHSSVWVYTIGIPFFLLAYVAIVAAEEDYLRRKFGADYERYCAEVPRWLLRLAGLSESLQGMRFNWRRVVVKEYGTTFTLAATVLALFAYETVTQKSLTEVQPTLIVLCAVFSFLVVAYAVARYLKKSGVWRPLI